MSCASSWRLYPKRSIASHKFCGSGRLFPGLLERVTRIAGLMMAQECQASGRMSMKFFPGCNLSCSSRDLADLSDHMSRFRISLAVTVFLTVTSGCAGYAPAGSPVVPDPALARGIASADSLIAAAVGTLFPG